MLEMSTYGVDRWDLQARTHAYDKFVKNPSKQDKESGLYFPRLTGFKRKNDALEWESHIKIEFSAPKLIYQNNLDELVEDQFEMVVEVLQDRLQKMGVVVPIPALRLAEVRTVHYSKNVQLTQGYTAQYVIGQLNKINLNKRFDLARARFLNDGQSLYAYTQAHSLVVYDKVADLSRGKKRAIDREQPLEQLALFMPLTKQAQPVEIVRFEVRLCQKQKINALFKQLGIAQNPTFKDAFSVHKSQTVLLHYWRIMLMGNAALLFAHAPTIKEVIQHILLAFPRIKGKEAIYRAGLLWVMREGNGMRELRTMLAKRTNDRSWYRLANEAKETATRLTKLQPREWCAQVERVLTTYSPFHTATLLSKQK
jgi:hypothetical protein